MTCKGASKGARIDLELIAAISRMSSNQGGTSIQPEALMIAMRSAPA